MLHACVQVIRAFFAALNAFNQATVGEPADDDNMYAAYDAVQHYMKFICMPKLSGQHTGPVCHASNHGTQVICLLTAVLPRLFLAGQITNMLVDFHYAQLLCSILSIPAGCLTFDYKRFVFLLSVLLALTPSHETLHIPHVFVCMQAMTGMIFKKLFNQALIVWDHCVYVRERLLWYDTEKAMPFLVRDTLARLHRAAAEVLYAEADLVTPCCATFNVNWEQWLGHAPETIMPVVNGLDFNQVKTSMQ